MTDLTKIRVGCRLELFEHDGIMMRCGDYFASDDEDDNRYFCVECRTIKDKVLPVLKAYASAHQKDVVIWRNEPITEVTSLRNIYYNLGRAEGARDAVLALTDEIKEKDLKKNGGD